MHDSREAAVSRARPVVTVIGEALIDLTPHDDPGTPGLYRARPGGSPFNVAVGLARLGRHTALMARLADDTFGRILRAHAAAEGVDLAYAPHAAEPTTLAVVSLDADARASYDLYFQGTADWQWTAAETARVPDDTAVLHVGSIASWTPPGDEQIHALTAAWHARGRALVSYDPNIRPALLREPARARLLVERYASIAHIVKASSEDVGWLYPGTDIGQVAVRWIELGTIIVVITDGAHGAHLFRAGSTPMHRPGRRVNVADTVGAGDAFTAGLLDAFLRRGVERPDLVRRSSPAVLSAVLDEAILISALTCERVGADPPTVGELGGRFL
ncbi:MAG: carbohydrate kinase family protein [Catenulispora sp.]